MYSIFYRHEGDTSPEWDRVDYEMLDWRYREVLALIASGYIVDRIDYGGETLLNAAQIHSKLGIRGTRPKGAPQGLDPLEAAEERHSRVADVAVDRRTNMSANGLQSGPDHRRPGPSSDEP